MTFHEWLIAKEGIWLFYVLILSLAVEKAILIMSILEYHYDARKDEEKTHKLRRTKKSVRIIVEDGQARVLEAPKDIDVTVEQRGQD